MSRRHLQLGLLTIWAVAAAGCAIHEEPPKQPQIYEHVGYKPNLPKFMQGTIYERTEIAGDTPYPVTAYSLVVNLQGTAENSELPGTVREAIIKRMQLAGFGQHNDPRYTALHPEDVLNDNRVAVVQVEGRLPVGARKGQRFDIIVRAMPHSNTSSLAHGRLYRTELYNNGLMLPQSHGTVMAYADNGDVFVNPAYALLDGPQSTDITASLRRGVVMGAGVVVEDRPIFLQLRVPEARLARQIEYRITNRFQLEGDISAARAQDAGVVSLYMPVSFNGDWQHFLAIVNHLYVYDRADFDVEHAHELVAAAREPGAPLTDISYCLEGLGPTAVPLYAELIQSPNPDIAYCGARAAACVGDHGAIRALVEMAIDATCPYQLAAVHTLGQLKESPAIDQQLEGLLSSDQRLVRIEAYKILSAHGDRRIVTEPINGKFVLDYVDCGGPPLMYATVEGLPRLAVFGQTTNVVTPITFLAMNHRLSITSNPTGDALTIFYRDPMRQDPVKADSRLGVIDLIARLGGIGPEEDEQLDFSYGDVVSILQSLSAAHSLVGIDDTGTAMVTSLMLEEPPELQAVEEVASVGPMQRPQGGPATQPSAMDTANGSPGQVGMVVQSDPLLPPGRTAAPTDTSSPDERPAGPPEARSNSTVVPSFGQ